MKKFLKFFGLAFIATSLMLVSCGKDEDENNNNNNNQNNNGEEVDNSWKQLRSGVAIQFTPTTITSTDTAETFAYNYIIDCYSAYLQHDSVKGYAIAGYTDTLTIDTIQYVLLPYFVHMYAGYKTGLGHDGELTLDRLKYRRNNTEALAYGQYCYPDDPYKMPEWESAGNGAMEVLGFDATENRLYFTETYNMYNMYDYCVINNEATTNGVRSARATILVQNVVYPFRSSKGELKERRVFANEM